MNRLLILVTGLTVGACSTGALRSGGVDGGGGNGGSGGSTGGVAGGTSGTSLCPLGETLCSACDATFCANECPMVKCAAGALGSGGLTITGGAGNSGGATGGTTLSRDAGLGGRVDGGIDVKPADSLLAQDASSSSCQNPLPLRCGDRLKHSTLVQGQADSWSTYACTARWMSGREAIYVMQTPTACQASVQLKNLTADLILLQPQSCGSMSCTAHADTTVSFQTEAGQPKVIVVDGYDGAAGSYTLEVDCTCNLDAGTIDAPPADARSDPVTVPGCDATLAAKTLSAMGLKNDGDAQMLGATLPTALAADANWGLKATLCQQGGYDLTTLAGNTVCLYKQDTTQVCQGSLSTAWVVMSNSTVACVYKTVRQGSAVAPGVYAANDANCITAAIAPDGSVACEGRTCTSATGPCCPATNLMSRVGMCASGCLAAVTCDGPEDCQNGAVCCSLESATGLLGAYCLTSAQCSAPSRVICHEQVDCPASQECGRPSPMPTYISTYPYAESSFWRVTYQVCAP